MDREQKSERKWNRLGRFFGSALFWVPSLTVALGCIFAYYSYNSIHRYEIESQSRESRKRAQEVVDQIDLRLSNSLLRIQSYEDYVGTRPTDYRKETSFLKQALKHTVFQRLSIFKSVRNRRGNGITLVRVFMVNSEDTPDATHAAVRLPMPQAPVMQNKILLTAVQDMLKTGERQRVVFHDYNGLPVVAVIVRSSAQSNQFMLYSTPTTRVFQNISLRPNETLSLKDPWSNLTWTVRDTETTGREIKLQTDRNEETTDTASSAFVFFEELAQSGLKLEIRFITKLLNNNVYKPLSFAWIVGIFGFSLTFAIAMLFWILLYQNRRVSRLVVEKTRDLARAHDEIHEALLVKTRFIGSISHEIRTPLNLILGMIDLCEERELDSEIRENLKSMRSSGNHLLAMIDDLLGLARSESSDLKLQLKPMNLVQFLDEIGRIAGQESAKKRLRLHIVLAPDLPSVVKCDPSRLRQILLNLIKNAFKYTNYGFVCLRVSPIGEVGVDKGTKLDQLKIRFEVLDSGIGIPPDKVTKIFDAFFQLDNTHLLSEGGVGLGLSIVKELVRKMDGKVEVTSELGAGSRFSVELSLEVSDSTPWLLRYEAPSSEVTKISVVSNDPLVTESVTTLVRHPSLRLRLDTDPKDGADDWIIVDSYVGETRLSAVLEKHDRKHVLLLGNRQELAELYPGLSIPSDVLVLNGCPVATNDLLIAMGFSSRRKRKFEPLAVESGPTPMTGSPILGRPLSVLVADDDEGNRRLYQAYLKGAVWTNHYAEDGQVAWDLYNRNKFDVLILDVRMPGMDGITLSEKIREREKAAGMPAVPILLVTADAMDDTQERARRISAVTYLTKPVRKAKLLEAISSAL